MAKGVKGQPIAGPCEPCETFAPCGICGTFAPCGICETFAPCGAGLHVWVGQFFTQPSPMGPEALAAQLLAALPVGLAARVGRFQLPQDRLLRLGGLTLLAHGLRRVAGLEAAEAHAALHYSPAGRPELISPALHTPWQVSFSYAFPFVACALRCGQPAPPFSLAAMPHNDGIGIDIEVVDKGTPLYSGPAAHFAHVFSPAEQEAIAHSADSGSTRVLHWTIKEAIYKAMGTDFNGSPHGINTCLPPATFSCTRTDPHIHCHQSTREAVYALKLSRAPQWVFWQSSAVGNACVTMAARTPWQEVEISFLRLVQKGHTLLLLQ